MKAEELKELIREVIREQQIVAVAGIDDDGHEVDMALSYLHKLEKYAPQVA